MSRICTAQLSTTKQLQSECYSPEAIYNNRGIESAFCAD